MTSLCRFQTWGTSWYFAWKNSKLSWTSQTRNLWNRKEGGRKGKKERWKEGLKERREKGGREEGKEQRRKPHLTWFLLEPNVSVVLLSFLGWSFPCLQIPVLLLLSQTEKHGNNVIIDTISMFYKWASYSVFPFLMLLSKAASSFYSVSCAAFTVLFTEPHWCCSLHPKLKACCQTHVCSKQRSILQGLYCLGKVTQ